MMRGGRAWGNSQTCVPAPSRDEIRHHALLNNFFACVAARPCSAAAGLFAPIIIGLRCRPCGAASASLTRRYKVPDEAGQAPRGRAMNGVPGAGGGGRLHRKP
jgi:hypothetical protein